MANFSDREKLGRMKAEGFPDTAVGSGIPAGWCGLVEGAMFRPYSIDEYHRVVGDLDEVSVLPIAPVTAMSVSAPTSTSVPTAIPPTPVSTQTTFSPSQVNEAWIRSTFGLAPTVRLVDLGDGNWKAPGQEPFHLKNPFEFAFDGERIEDSLAKIGIPAKWEGTATGATFWWEQYVLGK